MGNGKQGSYVGEYNGNILKSSYEYIFAKILESDNVQYRVEETTYLLDDKRYTPDFFLYDANNELYEIVEIRGYRFGIEERIDSTNKLRKLLKGLVKVSLYTEIDLKMMCKDKGLSYNALKTYWRTNPDNIRNSSAGKANPMYGVAMTDYTKALITERAKERVEINPNKYKKLGYNVSKWCRERNYDHLRGERVARFTLICERCGKEFTVIQGQKDIRKYCSVKCGATEAIEKATAATIEYKKIRDAEMRAFVLDWVKCNKDLVLQTDFNKIAPTLKPLWDLVREKYGVIDFRTIARAFNTQSRKNMLIQLKQYATN